MFVTTYLKLALEKQKWRKIQKCTEEQEYKGVMQFVVIRLLVNYGSLLQALLRLKQALFLAACIEKVPKEHYLFIAGVKPR